MAARKVRTTRCDCIFRDRAISRDREKQRLDAVREVPRKFIRGRPNRRIGIIPYRPRQYVVSPLTVHHEWLLQHLDRVRIGLVEGTPPVGPGMAAAATRLRDDQPK